jgi:3-oxoacyl-[acyl-carrier protein] reductase
MSKLENRVVLITGAGRGLGRMVARTLAAQGCIIASNDITPINVDEVVEEIISEGWRAKAYLADISKKMPVQAMVNEIIDDWGKIDILINYANVNPRASILEMDEWDWRRTIDVNLTGVFLVTQSVGRVMREQGQGKIINLIGILEATFSAVQLTTNFALEGFSQAVRDEFRAYNIYCHAIILEPERNQDDVLAEILTTLNS